VGRDAVGDVDYARLRADGGNHTVADPDEVIAHSVIGQERDHGGPGRSGLGMVTRTGSVHNPFTG
jgi:hypothetical protein